MKKIVIFLVFIMVLIVGSVVVIASVSRNKDVNSVSKEPTMEEVDKFIEEGGYSEYLKTYVTYNRKPFPENQIPVYSEDDLIFKKGNYVFIAKDASSYRALDGCPTSSLSMLMRYPTQALRQRDADTIYLVYDMDTGNRLFLFLTSEYNYDAYYGFPIILSGSIKSFNDFSSLKPGDSIERVIEIDPLTSIYKRAILEKMEVNVIAVENLAKRGTPVTSVHYLNDGLLLIEYSMPEEGNLVISDIKYSKDYKYTDCLGYTIDYTILDCDIPTK